MNIFYKLKIFINFGLVNIITDIIMSTRKNFYKNHIEIYNETEI